MVKTFEYTSIFNYSWEQICLAFWQRYPNPASTHVLSEDTIAREVRGDSLYTKRLLTKTNRPPKWGERFVKSTIVTIVEESYINPNIHRITTYTRNIGYTKIMSITEQVDYVPSAEDSLQTVVQRKAWVNSQIFGFRRAIEGFGVERFKKNCVNAVRGFNYVLQQLYPRPAMLTLEGGHISKFEERAGMLKKQAKRAGEIAKEKAGTLSSIYSASCQESNTPKMDQNERS